MLLRRWTTKLFMSMKCILLCSHSSPAHPVCLLTRGRRVLCVRVFTVFLHKTILTREYLKMLLYIYLENGIFKWSYRKREDLQNKFYFTFQ